MSCKAQEGILSYGRKNMTSAALISYIEKNNLDIRLCELYGEDQLARQRERYLSAINEFCALYGDDRDISVFSVSGRSELSGNHTDHNRGCVIAASINLDIIAIASARDDGVIRVKSDGYDEITVDTNEYTNPDAALFGTSASIIAGMCRGISDCGHNVGGFDAYMTSSVLKGSGLSSSAAFEVMIGNIENHFYNGGKINNVEIAKLAQKAENVFFGKPCGLMDQVACAHGGIVAIDFFDTSAPIIEKMDFDITGAGYKLCIVDTGGSHADLTDDYAAIPREMKSVAGFFGKDVLRNIDESELYRNIPALREKYGDRAILRALHFMSENKRVRVQKQALTDGNLELYLENVISSGKSSFCYLQNVYTTKNVREQGLSLALALAEGYLSTRGGAYRVHGGGFAGTVQAYVRSEDADGFAALMDSAFGEGACLVLQIRRDGAIKII